MTQTITLQRPASRTDYAELAREAWQPWADAYETWRAGVSGLLEQPKTKSKFGCDCDKCRASRCEPDPCACRCCVSDADLLLETRVGERRVISLEIENNWRREREIELELSSWTTTPEAAAIQARIVGPSNFTLAPCSHKLIVVEVQVGGDPQRNETQRDDLLDVTGCVVAYADLRIKGCDIRSLRLAVAVLSRDCGVYKVDCACGCC